MLTSLMRAVYTAFPKISIADWQCAYVQSAPPERKRGAILFKVEDNRWLVTLMGRAGDQPPSDEPGFLEFARSLPVPIIYDAIRIAEPVSPIKTHRATQNRLRTLRTRESDAGKLFAPR